MCSQSELNTLLKELASIYREVYGTNMVRLLKIGRASCRERVSSPV